MTALLVSSTDSVGSFVSVGSQSVGSNPILFFVFRLSPLILRVFSDKKNPQLHRCAPITPAASAAPPLVAARFESRLKKSARKLSSDAFSSSFPRRGAALELWMRHRRYAGGWGVWCKSRELAVECDFGMQQIVESRFACASLLARICQTGAANELATGRGHGWRGVMVVF